MTGTLVPITHPGAPTPYWRVAVEPGTSLVMLRIMERRVAYGCLDMTPAAARELADALNIAADQAETAPPTEGAAA